MVKWESLKSRTNCLPNVLSKSLTQSLELSGEASVHCRNFTNGAERNITYTLSTNAFKRLAFPRTQMNLHRILLFSLISIKRLMDEANEMLELAEFHH